MLEHLKLTAVVAAVSLCSACIIATDDDDDGASDSTNGNDSSNNADDANNEASGNGDTAGDADAGSDTSQGDTAGEDTGSASTGGGAGACGWGQTGQDVVPEGYLCGGEGEDPEGVHPIECPAELTLQEGAPCTDEASGAEITGVGCCGSDGNAWFCAEPEGGEPQLFTEPCG